MEEWKRFSAAKYRSMEIEKGNKILGLLTSCHPISHLRWEFIKENMEVSKQELDQESDQEKK